MIIKDIAMIMPNAIISSILKTVRVDIDEMGKQEIIKNHLYHITSEKKAKAIIESQHLRPATGILKNFNSYGRASVCLFNGTPSIENYIKNVVTNPKDSPYVNPTIVRTAIKISPTKKEELANYKVRALEDNVLLYEGYCVLPEEETECVKLVADLVRDSETGKPIINPKTGRYDISLREAKEEELSEDKKDYKPSEDYLQFIEEERKRLGFVKGNNAIANMLNMASLLVYTGRIEGEMGYNNTKENLPQIIKRKIQQFMTPKLDMATDEKIHSTINEFNTKGKNPYRDRRFGEAVAEFQAQGLHQLELKSELESLTTSENGKFVREKYAQIDKESIRQSGIHGSDHNNRVALYSMLIAQKEGLLDKDFNDKTKDILLSAAYYQDIGRTSKNSAKKIKNMDLRYANGQEYSNSDRRILQAVVEAHEGKDKNMAKICKKYKIDEQDMQYTMKLMAVLKDADALDRVRLDVNLPISMQTNLDPKYLRTNTSKQLLNASYQLESLTKKVSFDRILAYKTDVQQEGGIIESKRDKFIEGLRQGITEMPHTIQNMKNTLTLKKEKYASKLTGYKVMSKIKSFMNKENQQQEDYER